MTANQLIASIAQEICSGYADLARAIEIARRCMPYEPSLETYVYPLLAKNEDRKISTVSKIIYRAVQRLWEKGKRDELFRIMGNGFTAQAPPAKQLILYFAYYLEYGVPYHKIVNQENAGDYPLIQSWPWHSRFQNCIMKSIPKKQPVIVRTDHLMDGRAIPVAYRTEDGPLIEINSLMEIRQVEEPKAGWSGLRYSCKVGDAVVCLFYDQGKWSIESAD